MIPLGGPWQLDGAGDAAHGNLYFQLPVDTGYSFKGTCAAVPNAPENGKTPETGGISGADMGGVSTRIFLGRSFLREQVPQMSVPGMSSGRKGFPIVSI